MEIVTQETPRASAPAPRRARANRRRSRGGPSLASAVRAVEKRLTMALKERDRAAREWATWDAKRAQAGSEWQIRNIEVNSLTGTLQVLRGQQIPSGLPASSIPGYPAIPNPRNLTPEQIMSDQPLVPAAALAPSQYPIPIPELPFTPGRGGGGAMGGVALPDGPPTLDENEHLNASEMNTGEWR
jgi:hypothetical protein